METSVFMPQQALKYHIEVMENGRIEVEVPFSQGAYVTVFVIKEPGIHIKILFQQPRAAWIFGIIPLMTRIGIMHKQGDIVLISASIYRSLIAKTTTCYHSL